MGEWQEWKLILKRVGGLIRKVVSQYVEETEKELEKKETEKPAVGKVYTCKLCGETFLNRYRMANHIRYKHPKQ